MSAADNARDEIIADLDARTRRHGTTLDELQATLDGLGGTVTESAGLLAQAIPRRDTLAEQVAEVRGRASTGAGTGGDDEAVTGVVWEALTADQAVEEWTRLGQWVADVLGPWYELKRGHLSDCWALHRPVVRRLSALHTAYLAAYTGPAASAAAAADWHDRWLPRTLDLIGQEEPLVSSTRQLNEKTGIERDCQPGRHDGADAHGRAALQEDGRPLIGPATREATEQERQGQWHRTGTIHLVFDPIHPDHWGPFWRRAVDQDVAWRRAREAG